MARYNCAVFRSSEKHLKFLVSVEAGLDGYWREINSNLIQFKAYRGGSLQWWRSTQNAVVDGNWHPEDKARLLETIPTLHPDWRKRNQKRLKALAASKKNQDSVDTLPPTDEVHDEPIVIPKEVMDRAVQNMLSAL